MKKEFVEKIPDVEQLAVLTRIAVALERIAENSANILHDCHSVAESLYRLSEEHGAIPGRRKL
jgi:hypothetical protein